MGLTFYIVDVFAEEKYAGNQLAVIRGVGDLSSEEMRRIASEMNYSETTFITSDEEREGSYDVRIFTPREEVPFAGHPTLGTAFVIWHEIMQEPAERLALNLRVGRIPVTLGDVLWMRQQPPAFGETHDKRRISRILSLEETDLDPEHPTQEVSTGLPAIIVPLKNLDALKRCRVNRERYFDLVENTEAKTILAYSPEPYDNADLSVRVFADYYGVPEDPATGSANGCLAGYLVEHRHLGTDSVDIRVEQGYEIGRPSLLYLRAGKENGEIRVSVGGRVQMVARGELL